MNSLTQTVLLCIGVELAVVWVLRERTSLLRRTKLERLLYVAGLATLITQPIGLMIIKDLSRTGGFLLVLTITQATITAIEAVFYRTLGRLGWKKAAVFAVLTNVASYLVLLALYALSER